MKSIHSLLLASTAILAVSGLAPAVAAPFEKPLIVAQAAPAAPADAADTKRERARDKQAKDKVEADKKKGAQTKPAQAPAAPTAQQPAAPKKAERNEPAGQGGDDKRPQKRDASQDRKAPAATIAPAKPAAPSAEKPADKAPAPAVQAPAVQDKRAAPPAAVITQPQPSQAAPAVQPAPAAAAPTDAKPAAAALPPPTKARDANEFMRRDGQQQSRGMDDVRKERRETRDGNRVVIQEGDRTIVRDGNRSFIRHNEADRFAVGARNVRVDRRGNETISIIVRPNGITIVSTTDGDGHLLRRVRRDAGGREIVLIDNSFVGARRGDFFVNLALPRVTIPRERYIVDGRRANRDQLYAVFTAQPVERIERRYTLDQVRYSDPLRARMPRVDLDINFDTGSWQLTPDQIGSLSAIAEGLNRAIDNNPREVFLVEGYTDAVGSEEDNLSLSDRRAEAVAIALTEQFQVPPENLITQGYGEANPIVNTDVAERANRRVAVRRITPLMAEARTEGGPAR